MRLFATGAMSWVMGKALPDDVPIEARMVTRAIERAQGTVEARNAEIRKNVLQYDEVMNEQRKVVYLRRQQILDGADLRDDMLESLADAVEHSVEVFCPNDFQEDWDLDGLLAEASTYFPTKFTAEELARADRADDVYESLLAEATGYYHQREEQLGPDVVREIERRVMLSIIDQRWREHLYEMDYLQEGINLRAMGQRDPLVEWQRDGFEMFESFDVLLQGLATGTGAGGADGIGGSDQDRVDMVHGNVVVVTGDCVQHFVAGFAVALGKL